MAQCEIARLALALINVVPGRLVPVEILGKRFDRRNQQCVDQRQVVTHAVETAHEGPDRAHRGQEGATVECDQSVDELGEWRNLALLSGIRSSK